MMHNLLKEKVKLIHPFVCTLYMTTECRLWKIMCVRVGVVFCWYILQGEVWLKGEAVRRAAASKREKDGFKNSDELRFFSSSRRPFVCPGQCVSSLQRDECCREIIANKVTAPHADSLRKYPKALVKVCFALIGWGQQWDQWKHDSLRVFKWKSLETFQSP